jgi:hypothetical protein
MAHLTSPATLDSPADSSGARSPYAPSAPTTTAPNAALATSDETVNIHGCHRSALRAGSLPTTLDPMLGTVSERPEHTRLIAAGDGLSTF